MDDLMDRSDDWVGSVVVVVGVVVTGESQTLKF